MEKTDQRDKVEGSVKNQRMEVLSDCRQMHWNESCGVAIEQVTLFRDNQEGTLFVRCTMQNVSLKPIKAVMVSLQCRDVWGEVIGEPISQQYLDLQCKRGDTFGQTEPVEIPHKSTRGIQANVVRMMYEDGSVEIFAPEEEKTLPAPEPLAKVLDNEDLAEEFRRRTSKRARYAPAEVDGVWRCACGTLCRGEEETCPVCGVEKDTLFFVLKDPQLEEGMLVYKAELAKKQEEERLALEQRQREAEERAREDRERTEAARLEEERRAKKEKKKKRLLRTLIIGIPLLIALVCGILFLGIPYLNYRSACDALDRGEYDKAYAGFVDLNGQFGSDEKAKDARYQKAEDLLEQKSYDEAKTIFLSLGSFMDAETLAKECDYQKAGSLLEATDYDGAKTLFLQLGDYTDSADMAKESVYRKGMSYMESGKEKDYESAISCFEEISGYSDSREQWQEATYLLSGIYAKKKETKLTKPWRKMAAAGYESISGYKDSEVLFRSVISDWISDLMEESCYDIREAIEICTNLTTYMKESDKAKETVLNIIQTQYINDEAIWCDIDDSTGTRSFDQAKLFVITTLTRYYTGNSAEHKLFRFMESLADTFDDWWNGGSEWEDYTDKLRELRSKFDTYFDYPVIQAFIKYYAKQVYLEGYWSGSGYYLHFYKDSDGGTYSQFDLPWVSKPSGTKYYQIRNMNYIWINEEGDELAKVFKFELISPDVLQVYCYSNGRTYTLYR